MRSKSTILILVLASIYFGLGMNEAAQAEVWAVRGAFQNRLTTPPGMNPPADKSSSAAIFGGHYGPYAIPNSGDMPVTPSNGNVQLRTSAFGQIVARDVPFPNFIKELYDKAMAMLYWEAAMPEDRDEAAFRYKYKLYNRDNASGYIEAQFTDIETYWNEDCRARAWQAAQLLLDALKYAPWDRNLRWAVLDIYYDIAVADLAVAKEKMVEAYKVSLGIVVPPPGEYLISDEIDRMEEALAHYRGAIAAYFRLLENPMGVDVAPYTNENVPFGYYLFKTEVPNRSLYSPLMKDADGNWQLTSEYAGGVEQEPLFSGYKDLVMIFNAERDYAATAAELTRRYILRGMPQRGATPSDVEKAANLIATVQQQSYLEGALLTGIFPDITGTMKNVDASSGLLEAAASWRAKIAELNYLQAYLNGESNLLGFTDDFLAIIQPPTGTNIESFDTYKAYIESGPLLVAKTDLQTAKDTYSNFRDRQDQLALQFRDKNEIYNNRLREITGRRREEAGYDTPFNNEGSELRQQWLSIQMAIKRIEFNSQEIDNLTQQVEIEVWRRGQEHNINNAISTVYIQYGNKQAKLTQEIGEINANQVFANNMAQAAASTSVSVGTGGISVSMSGGAIAYTINAFYQREMERKKAAKQGEKERLGAQQSATIQSLNDQLLDNTSKANIKTWLLRMNTLVIQSQELALSMEQEWGRLAGLLAEQEDLERRMDEAAIHLADRYFADPIHRLMKDRSITQAEQSFLWAQRWLYFAARALEYKWNRLFIREYLGNTYTTNTLLALRNAKELDDMFQAMKDWDFANSIQRQSDGSYTKFSFRRDFLGYHCVPASSACCTDPITGEAATALRAFRSYLKQDFLYIPPNSDSSINPFQTATALRLTFSTVKEDPTKVFFGMTRWNEKIASMRIKITGASLTGSPSRIGGFIRYGGTNYLRTQNPGAIEAINPNLRVPEMRAYASKSWYQDSQNMWRSREYRSGAINIQIANDADVPDDTYEINLFHEYSVANSEWILYIAVADEYGDPILDLDNITDIEIHFRSRWNSRDLKH